MKTLTELPTMPFEDSSVLEISPRYLRLQEAEPVSRVRTPAGDPAWLVTRYDDVKALLSDGRLGRSHPHPQLAPRYAAGTLAGGPVLDWSTEKIDHVSVRRVMSRPLAGRQVRGLQPLVESVVQDLVDELIRVGPPVDLHERFSLPLPQRVLCGLFGVPEADRAVFGPPAQAALSLNDPQRALEALGELTVYAQELIERKRRDPDESLLCELLASVEQRGGLNDGLLLLMVDALLIAGQVSTTGRIDCGVLLLLHHPDHIQAIVADPALVPAATEEVLRLTAPPWDVPLRYAKEDLDCCGVPIRAGELVLLNLATANRDPRAFADPHRFDPTRSPNPHLAFGHGPSSCVGALLARIEMQAALGGLFRRLPGLRLAVPADAIQSRRDVLGGSLVSLPVTW